MYLSMWRWDWYFLRDQFLDDLIKQDQEVGLNHNIPIIQEKDYTTDQFYEQFVVP